MRRSWIHPLSARHPRQSIGGKAHGLQRLLIHGAPIPRTWVCTWEAHRAWLRNPSLARERLRAQVHEALDTDQSYAVRSSAASEDGRIESQAGQFLTVLRSQGPTGVIEALVRIWESASDTSDTVSEAGMGAVIQEMVEARASGIAFSRNPVTWAKEVVIEAVAGTGEALTQGTVTPHRWVYRMGELEGNDTLPQLPQETLEEIAKTALRLAALLKQDRDLEWSFDGHQVLWLQQRPITSERPKDVYSNRFSREYLPGLILPLVWEINIPMVNGAWLRLLGELIGAIDIPPERLAKRIGARAYFNMGVMGDLFVRAGLPRDVLEGMMGLVPGVSDHQHPRPTWRMLRHTPRAVRFLVGKLRYAKHGSQVLISVQTRLAEETRQLERNTDPGELLRRMDTYLPWMRTLSYHRILTVLLHAVIHRRAMGRLRKHGIEGSPSEFLSPDPRLQALDPASALQRLRNAYAQLPRETRTRISYPPTVEGMKDPQVQEFFRGFDSLIDRFGYLCDSGNDFSSVRWKETPGRVLQWAIEPIQTDDSLEIGAPDRPSLPSSLRTVLHRLAEARFQRESMGAVFTQAHGLLRDTVLKLGTALVEKGMIDQTGDVFYLTLDELRHGFSETSRRPDLQTRIKERKLEMDAAKELILPETIYGDAIPPQPASSSERWQRAGVPASRGIYTGPACIVRSNKEFANLISGGVLVIPFSDVSWTPLILRSSAVVTEAGGMLSHAAIIAREAGIPAVVCLENACAIPPGTRLRVDGTSGIITLEDRNRPAGSVS